MRTTLGEMSVKHKNLDAEDDLVFKVELKGTETPEKMHSNIINNSIVDREWINEESPNDGIAVICGSAPSALDHIDDIHVLIDSGAKIFACNDAALLLNKNGIIPDYQVIMDAVSKPEEVYEAKDYLFASTVNPELFIKKPSARLWHPLIKEIEDLIPASKTFCGIGGGITVANYCLCLIHTMGFRELHIFGMDSSFRDGRHYATHHVKVDTNLFVDVEYNGRIYPSTFDLKEQVNAFMLLSELLLDAGMDISVYGTGLLPDVFNEKYL